jgi:hypothetical protein
MQPLLPNKRRLMDSQEEPFQLALRKKRSRSAYVNRSASPPEIRDNEICARLVTTTKAGRKEGTRDACGYQTRVAHTEPPSPAI